VAAIAASLHAVLNKRDSRSALYWVVLSVFSPLVGPLLYLFFGINRVPRRAKRMRKRRAPGRLAAWAAAAKRGSPDGIPPEMASLARFMDAMTPSPLSPGNSIEPLCNAEEAYPPMFEAIERAEKSVTMCTYIFEPDEAGRQFTDVLARASKRGVEVRVLIDDVGALYGARGILNMLRQAGVRVATFLPTRVPGRFWHWNLRNHRKLLIVDGKTAFTGGMNVRQRHYVAIGHPNAVCDMQFRVRGPVVPEMQHVFAEDWAFTTNETLKGEPWFDATIERPGDIWARVVSAGPDEDIDKLRHTFHGAISCARRTLCIVTPFFLPDPGLITALNVAAMRGVTVDIVVPGLNHTRYLQWASTSCLRELIAGGCRVWQSPPPFDHTKLLIVDGLWSHVGSGNWDARSLRLNFELNLECYSAELAGQLSQVAAAKIAAAHPMTLAQIDGRSRLEKVRDGVARLWSPML
jgi:cardiolipin synthase